jgi:hypothetical protein
VGRSGTMSWKVSFLALAAVSGSALSAAPLAGTSRSRWVTLRGGETPADAYAAQCDSVVRGVLQAARSSIDKYAEEIDSGSCVVDFGAKCDAICNEALESFSSKAPSASGDASLETAFDSKVPSVTLPRNPYDPLPSLPTRKSCRRSPALKSF